CRLVSERQGDRVRRRSRSIVRAGTSSDVWLSDAAEILRLFDDNSLPCAVSGHIVALCRLTGLVFLRDRFILFRRVGYDGRLKLKSLTHLVDLTDRRANAQHLLGP